MSSTSRRSPRLREEAAALRKAPDVRRAALALRLYRQLALFVAENLLPHARRGDRAQRPALAALRDAELAELHGRLVSEPRPPRRSSRARWMLPASTTGGARGDDGRS
jgi:hypothetical protein